MKWLLKKLESTDGTTSPRLHFKAWLLLRELLVRTSITTSARLLKENSLMNSLQGTLQWLQENYNEEQLASSPKDHTSSELDESSNEAIESSSNEQITARKRKFDGAEIVPHRSSEGTDIALDTIYVAIFAAVRQLVDIFMDQEHVHGYAVEYMRAALRSSPEKAATVLGGSFNLLNHILQSPMRNRHQNSTKRPTLMSQNRLGDTAFEACVIPIMELWNLRSLGGRGLLDDSSNVYLQENPDKTVVLS